MTSIYSFRDPLVRRAIHAIKYFHRKDLLEPLSKELAHELSQESYKSYTLVPIPMPRLRRYMRGYNQAGLLAEILSKKTSLPFRCDVLVRTHNVARQVRAKERSSRLKNQRGSFRVVGTVENMNIALIDDVTTTGATINEARKMLLQAGARTVKVFTIAH